MIRLSNVCRLALIITLAMMPSAAGASGVDIQNIFTGILIPAFIPIWTSIAVLVSTVAGFTLLISHDEGAIDKAKKALTAVIAGSILTTIIVLFGTVNVIDTVYDGFSNGLVFNGDASAYAFEAAGLGDWLSAMAAMGGILTIIISLLKAVASFGTDEEAYTNVRRSARHIIIGLIIIGAAGLFRQAFFDARLPNPLIALVISKIAIVLGIMLVVALAILVYAGFRMVASFGRDEDYTAAKSLAIRVVLGIAIILISYLLVITVSNVF